jgi:hypothetical protein
MFAAVSPDDVRAIMAKLIEQAKAGDQQAARIVFDRTLGRPQEIDLIERIEEMERFMREHEQGRYG